MKIVCAWLLILLSLTAVSQTKDENEIRAVLDKQTKSWNKGNIEEFMTTYWHNDSLMFIGKSGIKWGWQAALDNYKKSYPDSVIMGKLFFNILLIKKMSPQYYYVVGKWYLKRTIGDLTGHYDLVLKRIKGQWLIIADHSS